MFDTQMGKGIVGGPLVSELESSRQTASTAIRILSGVAPANMEEIPMTAGIGNILLTAWGPVVVMLR